MKNSPNSKWSMSMAHPDLSGPFTGNTRHMTYSFQFPPNLSCSLFCKVFILHNKDNQVCFFNITCF